MALFRRKPDPDGTCRLAFVAEGSELIAVWPEWHGDEPLLLHLPSVVWDEYLRYVRGDREGEFDAFRRWVHLAAIAPFPEGPLWDAMPLLDTPPSHSDAVATIAVRMDYERQRVWAESTYEPTTDTNVLFELAPQVVWDWVFRFLIASDAEEAIEAIVLNLGYQVEYYETHGLAVGKDVGKAPFFGAMRGTSDRLIRERAGGPGLSAADFPSERNEPADGRSDPHETLG